jgi:hypothetical protein
MSVIYGPPRGQGPAISIIGGDCVLIQDLGFVGMDLGIYIGNSAGIRFINVGAEVWYLV